MKSYLMLLAAVMVVYSFGNAFADDKPSYINVNFKSVKLPVISDFFQEVSKEKFVLAPEVNNRRLSMYLVIPTLNSYQFLGWALESCGFAFTREGDSTRIAASDRQTEGSPVISNKYRIKNSRFSPTADFDPKIIEQIVKYEKNSKDKLLGDKIEFSPTEIRMTDIDSESFFHLFHESTRINVIVYHPGCRHIHGKLSAVIPLPISMSKAVEVFESALKKNNLSVEENDMFVRISLPCAK